MTSNDNQQYLTVELFNAKIDALMAQISLENEKLRSELKTEIQGARSELKAEIQDVRSIALVNSAKIEMLQHTFYWGFAIMTLIIAIVAILVPYLLIIRKEKRQEQTQQQYTTHHDVQDMITQALSTLNSGGKATM